MAPTPVSIASLPDKDESEDALRPAVEAALKPLGGIGAFVRKGQRVLLKPNQTLYLPEKSGSTTSPRLMRVLIRMCQEAGAREVWVGEASGHAQKSRNVMDMTGMVKGCKEAGAHMIFFDEIAQPVLDFGEEAGVCRHMPVPEIMQRADVIIDVPKAKTHFYDPISCACKNWVGVMPMSYRLWAQREAEPYYLATAVLLKHFGPHLTVVDGAWAGEGQGPGSNTPFWWGKILATTDPCAADWAVAKLFGLLPAQLRMVETPARMGVGVGSVDEVELVGATWADAGYKVKPADPSVHRYPVNVITGKGPGSNLEGTLGHWKTIADGWLDVGLWNLFTLRGRPTFLFGNGEDPDFEEHLAEGPYVVLDDAAQDKYKYHPDVTFVPGSPVPQSYMQNEMVEGMGFGGVYRTGLSVQKMIQQFKGALQATG